MLIVTISLFCGILVNQLNPQGIKLNTLILAITSTNIPVSEISADSAFVFLLQGTGQFVDIRSKEEFEEEHLPHALSKPFIDTYQQLHNPSEPGSTYILYGNESDSLKLRFLFKLWKKNNAMSLHILKGGMMGWMSLELPLEMRMDPLQ